MAATDVMPVKPPRPPNSWILYRAYMMKTLQPKDPREPRLSQSAMSSLISDMWKVASPEIKRHFEEQAERLKLEHHIKYPNYKYQPRKKEEKERAKELQRQQRQAQKRDMRSKRGVSASSSSLPPPIKPLVSPYPAISFPPALSPPVSAASSPAATDITYSPKPFFHNVSSTVASPKTPVAALPEMPQMPHVQVAPAVPAFPQGVQTFLPSPLPTPLAYLPQSLPAPTLLPTEAAPQNPGHEWQPPVPNTLTHTDCDSSNLFFSVNNWAYDSEVASFLALDAPGSFSVGDDNKVDPPPPPSKELSLSLPGLTADVNTYLKAAYFDKDPMSGLSFASTMSSMMMPMGNPLFSDVTANNAQFDFSSFMNPYPLESTDLPSSFFDCSYNLLNSYSDQLSPIESSMLRSTSDIFSHPSPSQQLDSSELTSNIASSSSNGYIPPSGATQSSARRVAGQWSLPSFISATSQG